MTPERMDWTDDERLYQPRIHSRHIRALHRICEEMQEPMTVLLDRALGEFVRGHKGNQTNSEVEAELCEDVANTNLVASVPPGGDPIGES